MLLETEVGRTRWLAQRTRGIGGSDVGPILGLSSFANSNPHSVWLRKTQPARRWKSTFAMDLGSMLEPVIASLYERETGVRTVDPKELFQHADHDCLIGSPDRLVKGQRRGVELKSAGWPDEDWGPPGSDKVPLGYELQCRHYMSVCDIDRWDIGVLFLGPRKFERYSLYRDRELEASVNTALVSWWNAYVVPRVPPPVDDSEEAGEALAAHFGKPRPEKLVATAEQAVLVAEALEARTNAARWTAIQAYRENKLREAMGAAETLAGDFGSVQWKMRSARVYTDWAGVMRQLVNEHGIKEEVVDELRVRFTPPAEQYRHFQIYPRKETAK